MGMLEIALLSLGLSMDAFAIAITIGLALGLANAKSAIIVGLYFGFFQALMPIVGFVAARQFAGLIEAFSHLIAFCLLSFLGVKMILGSFNKENETDARQEVMLTFAYMLPLSLATSIDAMVVGISFALVSVNVTFAVISIGVITFIMSVIGVRLGAIVGVRFKSKAELAGGFILVLIGIRMLLG